MPKIPINLRYDSAMRRTVNLFRKAQILRGKKIRTSIDNDEELPTSGLKKSATEQQLEAALVNSSFAEACPPPTNFSSQLDSVINLMEKEKLLINGPVKAGKTRFLDTSFYLRDDIGKAFLKYAKETGCSENIEFVIEYPPKTRFTEDTFYVMYNKYLDDASYTRINIPAPDKKKIDTKLKTPMDDNRTKMADPSISKKDKKALEKMNKVYATSATKLLNPVYESLAYNISEPWSRFYMTSEANKAAGFDEKVFATEKTKLKKTITTYLTQINKFLGEWSDLVEWSEQAKFAEPLQTALKTIKDEI